ncbi:MAG: S-methyl-5'-thioinosine phosphorylase [Pseudomonadota bacterium]
MPGASAIIGGSGLQELPGLRVLEQFAEETPWGPASAPVQRGLLEGTELFFLPRHGGPRAIPPHLINYRANIAALAARGVRQVFAFNAVGGIDPELAPGTLVVPDQLIDYTWGREPTYWGAGGGAPLHVEFTEPYDPGARAALLAAARRAGIAVRAGAVYAATQGPRLETAAEIRRLRRDGCDLVGMTGMPEAALAREQGLAYASLALVVNPAAGVGPAPITLDAIEAVLAEALPRAVRVLAAAIGAGG